MWNSWNDALFCISFRHKYEFLHNGWSPDLRITVNPVRIGVALDYERGTLSFFNVDLEQHLHTFHCHFRNYVHPCFSLDNPGALTIHNAIEAPEYAFIWHQQSYLLKRTFIILMWVLTRIIWQAFLTQHCFSSRLFKISQLLIGWLTTPELLKMSPVCSVVCVSACVTWGEVWYHKTTELKGRTTDEAFEEQCFLWEREAPFNADFGLL